MPRPVRSLDTTRATLPHVATWLLSAFLVIALGPLDYVAAQEKPRIIYINSHHEGYDWSDGVARGIYDRLITENISLTTTYLDAYRRSRPQGIQQAANEIRGLIEEVKPDVVISSGDEAFQFLISPHYENTTLPVVFSDLNRHTADGIPPSANITGILRSTHIETLIDLMSRHARGSRLGLILNNRMAAGSITENYSKALGRKFDRIYLARSIEEWKAMYRSSQDEVDMLILEHPSPHGEWDEKQIKQFVSQHTSIPVGSTARNLAPFSLITVAKIPEEQGWWAAQAAIMVLEGSNPSDIPIKTNKDAKLLINLELAERLNIRFSQEVIEIADVIK